MDSLTTPMEVFGTPEEDASGAAANVTQTVATSEAPDRSSVASTSSAKPCKKAPRDRLKPKKPAMSSGSFDLRAKLEEWRKNKAKEKGEGCSSDVKNEFCSGKRISNLSESSGDSISRPAKKLVHKQSTSERVDPHPRHGSERRQFHTPLARGNHALAVGERYWDGARGGQGHGARGGQGHGARGWQGHGVCDPFRSGQSGVARGAGNFTKQHRGSARGGRGGGPSDPPHGRHLGPKQHWECSRDGSGREMGNPTRGGFHQSSGIRGPRPLGFRRLTEWSAMEPCDVVNLLANSRNGFAELLYSEMQPDVMRLVVGLLAKACASEFKENKTAVLAVACDVRFQGALALHLSALHTDENRKRREACMDMFAQLLFFCETAVALLPVTAAERLGATLTFLAVAMDNVTSYHQCVVPGELRERLRIVQEQIKEQQARRAFVARPDTGRNELLRVLPPPNDYRQLPILPTVAEVTTGQRAFVRPNIVDGAYQDAEHYLDVQFRLLREDFVQPLRDGIRALAAGDDRHCGSVRVYRGVMFLEQVLSNDRVGMVVQFDPLPRFRWEQSKRLMFGSLLCFSRDGFESMMFATVMERKVEQLQKGQVCVEFAAPTDENLIGNHYLMLESEVFFAPYHHVLQALQKMPSDQFPMSNYIVAVAPQTTAPRYLLDKPGFQYRIRDGSAEHRVFPLINSSWPAEMTLNESQREAFKAALTREFVVIQGPPGTGKTHVGLMIARTIITNVPVLIRGKTHALVADEDIDIDAAMAEKKKVEEVVGEASNILNRIRNDKPSASARQLYSRSEEEDSKRHSPILVVCYTNHALDQFLEGLLDTTENIVRVGGQSKSERMAPLNIKERRLQNRSSGNARGEHWLGRNIHAKMSELMAEMRAVHGDLKNLDNHRGIVAIECIEKIYMHENLAAFCNEEGWLDEEIFLNWAEMGEDGQGWPNIPEPAIGQNEDREAGAPGEDAGVADPDDERRVNEDEFQLDQNVVFEGGVKYAVDFKAIENELADLYQAIASLQNGPQKTEHMRRARQLQAKQQFFLRWLKRPLPADLYNVEQLLQNNVHLWELSAPQRRACYEHWMRLLRDALRQHLQMLEADYRRQARRFEETKQMEDLRLMITADVVGMTTTMAAKLQPLLQALRPRIVIVEEAAEVTESHIVVALTHHCQHLILIGDHQQLRPNTATFRLARDFHLDISLFERMLRNGLHCSRLDVQHRMRPEIARLVAPAIYPNLANHDSVKRFEPMRGITRSMLFFTHSNQEDEVGETSSKRNIFEGDLVLAFCRYILQQGYNGEQVTILTTYSGQMFYLREARKKYPSLFDVKITIVDNYQGEENNIILLSLVRNNADKKIGFLSTENRVCVALSRAKQGFYIFGNMDSLVASSTIWPKIRDELEEQGALVEQLPLQCQVHRDQFTNIVEAADFYKVPEGGCRLPCNTQLLCGHICKRLCHGDDRNHSLHKCIEPCTRVPPECPLQHPCPRLCHAPCGDCLVPVARELPCGHGVTLACHVDAGSFECQRLVAAVDPSCGHAFEKPCHVPPDSQRCPHACEVRVRCGHSCLRKCHVNNDPDHIEYKCRLECARTNAGCSENHACSRRCWEPCGECLVQVVKTPANCQHKTTVNCSLLEADIICLQPCTRILPCGHPCPLQCYEECGGCQVEVTKTLNFCNHKAKVPCSVLPEHKLCRLGCRRLLPCGHPCPRLCRLPCLDMKECLHHIPEAATLVCGHTISLPCNMKTKGLPADSELLLERCDAPCVAVLGCGHVCPGSCGECLQGRVHISCKERCSRVLVCGHRCKSACADACPPCTKPCAMYCEHSYCNLLCGVPCPPCKMRCSRRCPHATCTKRCGEVCSCEPCVMPCKKRLRCKHPCMGFCGEPCPPLCRKCRPEEASEILFGNEDEPGARFVLLKDCRHSVEGRGMTEWLLQNAGEVKMLRCPRCTRDIVSTERYKAQVFRALVDIRMVKNKIFGHQKANEANREEILQKLFGLKGFQPERPENQQGDRFQYRVGNDQWMPLVGAGGRGRYRGWGRDAFQGRGRGQRYQHRYIPPLMGLVVQRNAHHAVDLLTPEEDLLYTSLVDSLKTVQRKRKVFHSRSDLETIRVKTDILIDVHETLKGTARLDEHSKSALTERAGRLLRSVCQRQRLSAEEVKDLGLELRRFQRIETLVQLEADVRGAESELQTAYAIAQKELLGQKKYSSEQDIEVENMLKDIAIKCKNSVVVTRKMVVKALHMTPGHWFKCPNGHYYVIGDCGGAVVESRCPECNAVIGGSGHRLREGNSVATEMDGATHSAFDLSAAAFRRLR